MSVYDYLSKIGAYPTQAKGALGTKPMESMVNAISRFDTSIKERADEEMKKKQKMTDIYRVLRDAGYSKDQAYGMSLKESKMPMPAEEMAITGKPKEPSRTEAIETDIQNAKAGTITWDEIKAKYPLQEKNIEEARKASLPPIGKSPQFKEGWGLPALLSKNKAKLNPTTRKVVQNTKNVEDLTELINNEALYSAEGVDIDAILEYFGVTREQVKEGSVKPASYYSEIPGTVAP